MQLARVREFNFWNMLLRMSESQGLCSSSIFTHTSEALMISLQYCMRYTLVLFL